MTEDLGFFAPAAPAPGASPPFGAPPPAPFGTSTPVQAPFGTPVPAPFGAAVSAPFGEAAGHQGAAPATPSGGLSRLLVAVAVGLVALLAVGGLLVVRAWKDSGTPPQTTVSTPPTIGSLARTTGTAPDLAALQPDLAAAVTLQPALLATYTSGPVSAQVLVARPVRPMLAATQSQVLTAVTAGLERLTGVPPQLSPVMAGMSMLSPFGCSQVELGSATPVFCAATSGGAVTLVLVSGEDYAAATHTAADVRAGVEHRG